MAPNSEQPLKFSKFLKSKWLTDAQDFEVKEPTIVVNISDSEAIISASSPHKVLRPRKSTILRGVKIVSGESLVLIKLPDEDNLGGVILDEGWYQLSAQNSTYPRDVPLYKSPQFEVGNVEFDPYIVTGTEKPSQGCGVKKYNIKVNVWFSPAKTHCGIHNHQTDPGMLEVHTQVYGTGRMQKFHENDFKSLYEEVMMAPGFTHDPFTGVKENGDLFYGWHQYYSDTDCIWMAIEYHQA